MFEDFFQGVGSVVSDALNGARDVLVAREQNRVEAARLETAGVASRALAFASTERFKIAALALVGLGAIFLFTRKG